MSAIKVQVPVFKNGNPVVIWRGNWQVQETNDLVIVRKARDPQPAYVSNPRYIISLPDGLCLASEITSSDGTKGGRVTGFDNDRILDYLAINGYSSEDAMVRDVEMNNQFGGTSERAGNYSAAMYYIITSDGLPARQPLSMTLMHVHYNDDGTVQSVTPDTLTIDKGHKASLDVIYIPPHPYAGETGGGENTGDGGEESVAPVDAAPDVLPVNANFDRGDTAGVSISRTGASPDYKAKTLIAARDNIDRQIKKGDRVTNDLHNGWFGLGRGQLPVEYFEGATITIRKVEKTDPETNKPESGQIRLYATWGEKNEKCIEPYDIVDSMSVEAGLGGGSSQPINLVPIIYAANSTVPADAQLWIEGIKPGKITLEWRLQKGSIDVKFEQTFNVENDWTKEQWQAVVRDELYVDSFTSSSGAAINGIPAQGLDINNYVVANGFLANRPYIYTVYEYYAKLHEQNRNDQFLWAGLAKMAGAPVYAGLSDCQNGRDMVALGSLGLLDDGSLRKIQNILVDANIRIFNDLAYQFVAYRTSGISAIKYLNKEGSISKDILNAWKKIDDGYKNNTFADIIEGNKLLLYREQNEILKKTYQDVDGMRVVLGTISVSWLFSWMTQNPVTNGITFKAFNPNGNIANFDDRWQWIMQGMWPIWMNAGKASRISVAGQSLISRAWVYRTLAPLR